MAAKIAPLLPHLFKKLILRLTVALLLFLLWSGWAHAQVRPRNVAFTALTINDGLSQGMVTQIFQDRYGFMWFATLDGLNRYDGYHFTTYHHDARDTSSLTSGIVQHIFEDSEGRIWIATATGGLDLFKRENETFLHLRVGANSDTQRAVNAIVQDQQKNIWLNLGNKLEQVTIYTSSSGSPAIRSRKVSLPFQANNALTTTSSGNLYCAEPEAGRVYRLNQNKWSLALDLPRYLQPAVSKGHKILQIMDVMGKLMIISQAGMFLCSETTGLPIKHYPITTFQGLTDPINAVTDLHGIVWFLASHMLFFLNLQTGELNTTEVNNEENDRSLRNALNLFVDKSGLLWVATNGYGMLKRNALSDAFHHTGAAFTYYFKEGNDGKMIVGDDLHKYGVFDKARGAFITDPAYIAKAQHPFITAPEITAKGVEWYAESNKLYRYQRALGKIDSFPLPIATSTGFDQSIQCKVATPDGNLWVGTLGALAQFNVATRTWKVYKSSSNDSSSLSSSMIYALCLDPVQPARYLWVGTGGGGLNRMDMTSGKCIFFGVEDGLPNNVICGILSDGEGNLWMSTNKGISCFNPTAKSFKNFSYKDGLQSNEFNRGAYLRTRDGQLFFGGINGFNYFNPRDVLRKTAVPQVQVTNMKILNKQVQVNVEGSPLSRAIYLTKEITLPYSQNVFSFDFAAMDFTNPEQNRYQYKLEGFDKDWTFPGEAHSATYTNLDPGTYTFRVRGSNNEGVWNKGGASINITILAPWYNTWWFKLIVVAILLMLGYSIYRYRIAQALKLQSIRDRIAGDLHDEVGSNLSNIYIFSKVAQQKKSAEDSAPLLEKIADYTRQSMEAMNDIVWMINTRNDRFENIMVRMRTLAAEFTEASGCNLHLDLDESLNDVKLNMEARKNFYLIYKEAINNAAKHASCGSLWIDMKLQRSEVVLTIKDDGNGFDIAGTHHGNGLYNMRQRAEVLSGKLSVTSAKGEGTSLQLNFPV